MSQRRIVIVGYGNIGEGVHFAIDRNADMKLTGILSRGVKRVEQALEEKGLGSIPVLDASADLDFQAEMPADVAILCGGSKDDLPVQGPKFARHYNVVDSFDSHAEIPEHFEKMDRASREAGNVAIISTGWDPGTFSDERVKADAFIPGASIYTFWGPGVSQGHSDAARRVEGVKDARQYTLPQEEAMERVRAGDHPDLGASEKHKRLVYVVAEEGADRENIEAEIKAMPHYFEPYETEVRFIEEKEMASEHGEMRHGGFVIASGTMGHDKNALIEYRCSWESNPDATASILVAHARAAHRLSERGEKGARTILDICPSDLSPRSHAELLRDFT